MAIKIIGVTSGAEAEVDATAKALRATMYRGNGQQLFPDWVGEYTAKVDVVPTTLTANTVYWTIKNTGIYRAFIHRLTLIPTFAGTAAASRSIYNVAKILSGTPAGGTTFVAAKMGTTDPAASIGDLRFAPGGITGAVFEGANIALIPHINQLGISGQIEVIMDEPIELTTGEGLGIRAESAIVLGSALHGYVSWSERA